MEPPRTRYARSGEVNIAYQVLGEGAFDLIFAPGFVSNVEYGWEEPTLATFYRRLASFCRLVIFDKRGTGLSDRVSGVPDLETRMDDVRAVMDAVGSDRAAVLGYSEGAAMAALFAAAYPERCAALVFYGPYLYWLWSAEGRSWSERGDVRTPRPSDPAFFEEFVRETEQRWGDPAYCDELLEQDAPSMLNSARFRRWYARRLRLGASPRAARDLVRMNFETDIRAVLPSVRVPTLILHREGDRSCDLENSRYAAKEMPDAQYLELPGHDHLPWVGNSGAVIGAVERFLTGVWEAGGWEEPEPERVLTTVMFTDIVDSTAKAVELGDNEWRKLLEQHHGLVRRHLARYRGSEIDTAGDGFLASFDGPARAIRCAMDLVESVRTLGLEIRAGLHTGECEIANGKLAGIGVVIGARVAANAGPGEVLVSSTLKDLVAGSGLQFADRGAFNLKGIPGAWHLYTVI